MTHPSTYARTKTHTLTHTKRKHKHTTKHLKHTQKSTGRGGERLFCIFQYIDTHKTQTNTERERERERQGRCCNVLYLNMHTHKQTHAQLSRN